MNDASFCIAIYRVLLHKLYIIETHFMQCFHHDYC